MGEEEGEVQYNAQGKRKGKHDKPKPWDTPDIDHWKVEPFQPAWNEGGLLEESSFCTLFPQYREKYLQEVWPIVTKKLKEHGIACKLNLTVSRGWGLRIMVCSDDAVVDSVRVEGSMTVLTTRKTRDPYIIVKARDLLKLLSRSVPALQALKILEDEMQCDIIKIGNLIRNKERFVKRRHRLLGPNGATLKAIELLTGCYMLVQGNTVAAMGPFKGLKVVRRIVEDCIHNVHPIYHIKALMIKRELAKDPELANQNWDRFLPKFKKKNVKQKKTRQKEKKSYTPFPPPQQPSKVDLQLESGEYFLSAERKAAKKWQEKQEKQNSKAVQNKRKREAAFVPPKEAKKGKKEGSSNAGASDLVAREMSTKDMARELKGKVEVLKQARPAKSVEIESFLAAPKKHKE